MRIKLWITYRTFCTVLIIVMLIVVIIIKNRYHGLSKYSKYIGNFYGGLLEEE